MYRITVKSVFAEGESNDSNPVIALLSNNQSRDSSLLTTPWSSFPPSPEKSIVTMTIKEEDNVEVKQEVSTENVVDDLVKENSMVKEETYSTHTTSSDSGSSVDLNDPTGTVHELRNTFTVAQENNLSGHHDSHTSLKGNPHITVQQESSHDDRTQGVSLEGDPHNESKVTTTTTQGVDATRENPLDVPSDNPPSHCNSLQSLHSTLTTSSDDSPVATPTSNHSPKRFHQSVEQRRSFFPPILDFSEDKSTDNPLDSNPMTTDSTELANQLLSALEKELSDPLLKPTTCT